MNSDDVEHDVTNILSLVQEQMHELSVMQQRRSELTAKGTAADGTVQVTINAGCMVTDTVIDESYLDDFEFADLGTHITTAAQQAVQEIERRAAAMLAPMTERRREISSLSGIVADAPDFGELISTLNSLAPAPDGPQCGYDDGGALNEDTRYPTVRR